MRRGEGRIQDLTKGSMLLVKHRKKRLANAYGSPKPALFCHRFTYRRRPLVLLLPSSFSHRESQSNKIDGEATPAPLYKAGQYERPLCRCLLTRCDR